MIGNPRGINSLPFQKALVQCPIPDESVRLARHEKTSALEDRLASDCSVYENSLFSSANIKRQAGLIKSTGLEMVSMIEDQYKEYGLDEDYIEIEDQDQSRATGDTYMLVSLEGYYGIVRIDGRREDVEVVSDDYRFIEKMYDNNLG